MADKPREYTYEEWVSGAAQPDKPREYTYEEWVSGAAQPEQPATEYTYEEWVSGAAQPEPEPEETEDNTGFFRNLKTQAGAAVENIKLNPSQFKLQQKSETAAGETAFIDAYKGIDLGMSYLDAYYDNLNKGITLDPARLRDYEKASPEERQNIIDQSQKAISSAVSYVTNTLPELEKRQQEIAEEYAPSVEGFTDIRSLADARDWLGGSIGAGGVYLGSVMAGTLVAGPAGGLAVGTGLALGETVGNRLSYILETTRNLSPEDQAQIVMEYLNQTSDVSMATALASGALDLAGPAATIIKRRLLKEAGEELLDRGIKDYAEQTGRELVEEGITGGLQEATQITGERILEEQTGDILSKDNIKRIVNAATAEAAGSLGGSAFNVTTQAGGQYLSNRMNDLVAEEANRIARLANTHEKVTQSQDEIAQKLEEQIQVYMQSGLSEDEAFIRAAKEFASPTGFAEDANIFEEEIEEDEINFGEVDEASEQDTNQARYDALSDDNLDLEDFEALLGSRVEPTIGNATPEELMALDTGEQIEEVNKTEREQVASAQNETGQEVAESVEPPSVEDTQSSERAAEQQAEAKSSNKQRANIVKALQKIVDGTATYSREASLKRIAKKTRVGFTEEDIAEFTDIAQLSDKDQLERKDTLIKAYALEAKLANPKLSDEQAKKTGAKTFNSKQQAFNGYQEEELKARSKRVTALVNALAMVGSRANASYVDTKKATELLTNPNIDQTELDRAQREYEQRQTQSSKAKFVIDANIPDEQREIYVGESQNLRSATGDVSLAINTILSDPDTSNYTKAILKYLQPALAGTEVIVIESPEQFAENNYGEDLVVSSSILTGKAAAVQSVKTNSNGVTSPVIYLNALGNTEISGLNPTIVAHEMVHAATAAMLDAYENDPNSVSPTAAKAIIQLQKLHFAVHSRFKNQIKYGKLSPYQIETLQKALVNAHELMAYGLSDPMVQEFLLNMPPETSWAEGQSWNGLSYFTRLIRKILGIPEGQKTAFDNLVDLTGRLAKFNQLQIQNRPSTSSINFASSKSKRNTALVQNLRKSSNAANAARNITKMVKSIRNFDDAVRETKAMFDALSRKALVARVNTASTRGIARFSKSRLPGAKRINDTIQEMARYRNGLLRELAEKKPEWEMFVRKYPKGAEILSDTMNMSTLLGIDPSKYGNLQETLAKDEMLIFYRSNLKKAIANKASAKLISAIKGKITKRENEIRVVFKGEIYTDPEGTVTIYGGWDRLAEPKLGNSKGQEIYRMAKEAYALSHKRHMQLLLQNVRNSALPEARKQDIIDLVLNPQRKDLAEIAQREEITDEEKKYLSAEITAIYQAQNSLGVYFPLMRYGDYFLSVGKGVGREFYLFESEAARNSYVSRIVQERPLPGVGRKGTKEEWIELGFLSEGTNGQDAFRVELEQSHKTLKAIYDMLDQNNTSNNKALRDQIYQL